MLKSVGRVLLLAAVVSLIPRVAQAQAAEERLRRLENTVNQKADVSQVRQLENALAGKANSRQVERLLDGKASAARVQSLERELAGKVAAGELDALDARMQKSHEDVEDLGNRVKTRLIEVDQRLEQQSGTQRVQGLNVNRFWVLLAALLVFFMQAGFASLEVGMVSTQFSTLQALYKLAAWIATLAYFFSFGLMFSAPSHRLFGYDIPHLFGEALWWSSPAEVMEQVNCTLTDAGNTVCKALDETDRGTEFFLFQLAFAATAVTIPSGAIAERMSLFGYFVMGLVIAVVAYPLLGHWAWGGSAYLEVSANVQGWLKLLGFHDFAGSTVVHSVGGWFALAGARALGPRNPKPRPRNRGYAILGVFLLWFGWWGFNGGSVLAYDNKNTVPNIILNTNIAASAAGLTACVLAWLTSKRGLQTWLAAHASFLQGVFRADNIPEKAIGGVLGGLVAITASCDVTTPGSALAFGMIAGVAHNMAFDWLLHKGIDDPVGAVPVHLACGIVGTLLVSLAPLRAASDGPASIQLLGVVTAGALSYSIATLCFSLLGKLRWLKLTDAEARVWSG